MEIPYDYEEPGLNYYVIDKEIKDFTPEQKVKDQPYWAQQENKGPEFSNVLQKIRKEHPKRHLDILLRKYGKLKEEEEALKTVQEVQNIHKNHERKALSQTGQKGHKRRGYYASSNPYDDLNELIRSVKRTREQNDDPKFHDGFLLEQEIKPRNFMLNHQDYFAMKSFMIEDLTNLTVQEQNYLENKRMREEAKKRLEHSLTL